MLGDTTQFGPVDLLGALALNAVATNQACKATSFRVGMKKKGSENVPAYADYRFLGGIAAAAAGQFLNDPRIQRVGHDVACGLLGSYVATETCRKHAEKIVENANASDNFAQISADAPQVSENRVGASNYVYGW